MTRRIFEATAPDGEIVRRTSETKVYSHAVVRWLDAYTAYNGTSYDAGWMLRAVEWCSRRDLAEKKITFYRNRGKRAEILEAREVTK